LFLQERVSTCCVREERASDRLFEGKGWSQVTNPSSLEQDPSVSILTIFCAAVQQTSTAVKK
jgi:hypothetical protein